MHDLFFFFLKDNGAARDRYGQVIRSGRDRDREDRHWEGGRDLQSGKPFVWGETYGLSPNFLEGLGIAPPLVCRVFVANVSCDILYFDYKKINGGNYFLAGL